MLWSPQIRIHVTSSMVPGTSCLHGELVISLLKPSSCHIAWVYSFRTTCPCTAPVRPPKPHGLALIQRLARIEAWLHSKKGLPRALASIAPGSA